MKPLLVHRTEIVNSSVGGWSVALTDCDGVVDELYRILTGWELTRQFATAESVADVSIRKTDGGYSWESRRLTRPKQWDEIPPRTVMNVVSDIHDVLFDWFLSANPYPCLHTGAVRIGDGLVCFPSVRSSGKSTLCAELVACGHPLFCDDVLPIVPDTLRGFAMGIAPMLRLPLPKASSATLKQFAESRRGISNQRWSYLYLMENEIALFGTTAQIRHLVLLDRQRGGRARLVEIPAAEMLREVILQNFGSRTDPDTVLNSLHALVSSTPCLKLTYSDLGEAREMLERHCR